MILYLSALNERNEIINFAFNFETQSFFFQGFLIIKIIDMIQITYFLRVRYDL